MCSASHGDSKRDTVRICFCCPVLRRRCCPAPPALDRYFLHAGRPAANPPHATTTVDRRDRQTDRQTDGRTDIRPLHRSCCACHRDSANKLRICLMFQKMRQSWRRRESRQLDSAASSSKSTQRRRRRRWRRGRVSPPGEWNYNASCASLSLVRPVVRLTITGRRTDKGARPNFASLASSAASPAALSYACRT